MWFLSGGARCDRDARLDNKTVIVTGANSGIGKALALDFVRRGARVLMLCRDMVKAELAVEEIRCQTRKLPDAGIAVLIPLDLASFASIRKCAKHILDTQDHIHLLINNAGVCLAPERYTEEGFELHMGVNHIGHFLLTCLLLPRIIRSAPARIINVSSKMSFFACRSLIDNLHGKKQSYSSWYAYAESKLANILFTNALARRLQGTGVTTYSVHPGAVVTDAARWFSPLFKWFYYLILIRIWKTPEQGAQTIIHCAIDEEAGKQNGLYYEECKATSGPALGTDPELAQKLWEESIRLVKFGDSNPITTLDEVLEVKGDSTDKEVAPAVIQNDDAGVEPSDASYIMSNEEPRQEAGGPK